MDKLERELKGRAQVLRISAGSAVGQQLIARYGVRGVPTFVLFDGAGQILDTQVGRLDAVSIRAQITSLGR